MKESAARKMENDLSTLPKEVTQFLAADHGMYIGGKFVAAASGDRIPVIDPTSGDEVAFVPKGEHVDVDRAVTAARKAFEEGPWPRMKPSSRERILLKLADLLFAHGAEIADIESVNSGRTVPNTRAFDVDLSVDYLRYMAGWATKLQGNTYSPSVPYVPQMNFFSYTLREPVGVVGAITPWNVPLCQAIWKIAPVLATGCTMVLKPAEQTPLTALRFATLFEEAGLPPGVVNIVTGLGHSAGAALVDHPGIDKISFTGSTEVGQIIAARAGGNLKRCTLELGGKSAMLVMRDADAASTIPGTAMAIFGNHGQNCCAGSRLYVHKDRYDEIVEGVVNFAKGIKLGPSLAPDTQMGPLITKGQQKRVLGYINSGLEEGAELLTGGNEVTRNGCYVEPTVLGNVQSGMRVVQEEIFGPVLVVTPFDDLEDAVQKANMTRYGLGASIWSNDLKLVHNLIPRLRAGTVWVNTHNVLDLAVPFGGVKASGMGRELSEQAVFHHTELKTVTMAL